MFNILQTDYTMPAVVGVGVFILMVLVGIVIYIKDQEGLGIIAFLALGGLAVGGLGFAMFSSISTQDALESSIIQVEEEENIAIIFPANTYPSEVLGGDQSKSAEVTIISDTEQELSCKIIKVAKEDTFSISCLKPTTENEYVDLAEVLETVR